MLKHEGTWQALSPDERLFLLAIAYELPRIHGLQVLWTDVRRNSGIPDSVFMKTAKQLEEKNLLFIDPDPMMFQLCGDAVTWSFTLGKQQDFERYELEHPRNKQKASPLKRPLRTDDLSLGPHEPSDGSIFCGGPQF